jgi:hypothetical protein
MLETASITHLKDLLGHRVEIFAFGISYLGTLESVDFDEGTLKIVDGEDSAILELERVESFCPAH